MERTVSLVFQLSPLEKLRLSMCNELLSISAEQGRRKWSGGGQGNLGLPNNFQNFHLYKVSQNTVFETGSKC